MACAAQPEHQPAKRNLPLYLQVTPPNFWQPPALLRRAGLILASRAGGTVSTPIMECHRARAWAVPNHRAVAARATREADTQHRPALHGILRCDRRREFADFFLSSGV